MAIWRALFLASMLALVASPARADQPADNADAKAAKKAGKGAPEIEAAGLAGAAALVVGGVLLFGTRAARRRRT
jgi:hypothetical protein